MVGGGIGFLAAPIASSGSTGSIASGGRNTRPGWGPTPSGSDPGEFRTPSTSSMLGSLPLSSATRSGCDDDAPKDEIAGSERPASGRAAGASMGFKRYANGSSAFDQGSPSSASGSSVGVLPNRSVPAPTGGGDPLREEKFTASV